MGTRRSRTFWLAVGAVIGFLVPFLAGCELTGTVLKVLF